MTENLTAALEPEERAEYEQKLAELHERGYVDIENHKGLSVGVRVRHRGHQWPAAYRDGTGTVLAITEKPDSVWSRSWGAPDIEMVVLFDTATFGSRLSMLAQYHVDVPDGAA